MDEPLINLLQDAHKWLICDMIADEIVGSRQCDDLERAELVIRIGKYIQELKAATYC